MSSAPYFKLYFSDLAGDTLMLSDAEMGSYVLLIGAMWNAGGWLPNDPAKLSRIARVSPKSWPKRWAAIRQFFVEADDEITHKRVSAEAEKVRGISKKRSDAGTTGAEAKRLKNNETAQANAGDITKQTHKQNVDIPDTIARDREDADASSVAGAATKGDVRKAFEAWNDLAKRLGLPVAKTLDDGRRKAIAKRLEDGGLPAWLEALAAVERSAHCRGDNDRGWKADLDFVCQLKSWRRLREGFYGATAAPESSLLPQPAWPGPADVREAVERGFGDPARACAFLRACRWRDVPDRALVSDNSFTLDMIRREAGAVLAKLDVRVVFEKGRDAA